MKECQDKIHEMLSRASSRMFITSVLDCSCSCMISALLGSEMTKALAGTFPA